MYPFLANSLTLRPGWEKRISTLRTGCDLRVTSTKGIYTTTQMLKNFDGERLSRLSRLSKLRRENGKFNEEWLICWAFQYLRMLNTSWIRGAEKDLWKTGKLFEKGRKGPEHSWNTLKQILVVVHDILGGWILYDYNIIGKFPSISKFKLKRLMGGGDRSNEYKPVHVYRLCEKCLGGLRTFVKSTLYNTRFNEYYNTGTSEVPFIHCIVHCVHHLLL